MPTDREREYYRMGFEDGVNSDIYGSRGPNREVKTLKQLSTIISPRTLVTKRKLSAWQKYIKNPRNHIKYRDGKLNLKKMGVAYRRKRR